MCKIVVARTTQSVVARNSCSPFNVSVGLLTASLTSVLLVCRSILEGCPVLGYVTAAPYFFYLVYIIPWRYLCILLLPNAYKQRDPFDAFSMFYLYQCLVKRVCEYNVSTDTVYKCSQHIL